MKRLIEIQQKLKAPKTQYNDFWHYKYRSCEDILQAVKPLLAEQKLVLILQDEVVCVWERTYSRNTDDSKKWIKETVNESWCRYYIKATAKLYDDKWTIIAQTSAFAREEEEKRWQDWSQISWSSSSYARKYCLAWMFLLDSNDWIDSDATNKWNADEKKTESKSESKPASTQPTVRFNDPELEQLKANTDRVASFETSNALIEQISTKYKISKEMKIKIADVRAEIK